MVYDLDFTMSEAVANELRLTAYIYKCRIIETGTVLQWIVWCRSVDVFYALLANWNINQIERKFEYYI